MQRCNYLVPNYFGYNHELEDIPDSCCHLKTGHKGPHLVKGNGTFILWKLVDACPEPDLCEDLIHCDHFEHWSITDAEALQCLHKEGPS